LIYLGATPGREQTRLHQIHTPWVLAVRGACPSNCADPPALDSWTNGPRARRHGASDSARRLRGAVGRPTGAQHARDSCVKGRDVLRILRRSRRARAGSPDLRPSRRWTVLRGLIDRIAVRRGRLDGVPATQCAGHPDRRVEFDTVQVPKVVTNLQLRPTCSLVRDPISSRLGQFGRTCGPAPGDEYDRTPTGEPAAHFAALKARLKSSGASRVAFVAEAATRPTTTDPCRDWLWSRGKTPWRLVLRTRGSDCPGRRGPGTSPVGHNHLL